jgi:hypothetical protein
MSRRNAAAEEPSALDVFLAAPVTAVQEPPERVVPPAPDGLGAAGRALWDDIQGELSLEPGEEALLLEACRASDELDQLAVAVAAAPAMVEGSTGQPRVNPLYEEVRRHRDSLAKLLARLKPAEASPTSGMSVSELASHAATQRWKKTPR